MTNELEKHKQLDQLKAENNLFRICHDKEQAKRRKFEQCLTEIKEIIHFNKTNRLSGGACISIEQILQKISECEGNDE